MTKRKPKTDGVTSVVTRTSTLLFLSPRSFPWRLSLGVSTVLRLVSVLLLLEDRNRSLLLLVVGGGCVFVCFVALEQGARARESERERAVVVPTRDFWAVLKKISVASEDEVRRTTK